MIPVDDLATIHTGAAPWTDAERMPATGTTRGDVGLPLYRFIDGETLRGGDYGMHWTHDRAAVEQMASEEAGFIVAADHPGYSHVMDWENAADRTILEREVGGYEYRDSVFPEVPIRPGTEMTIRRVEKVTADGVQSAVSDITMPNDTIEASR